MLQKLSCCSPLRGIRACTRSPPFRSRRPVMSWTPRDMPDQAGKTFVITGASSGIGFQAAKELAAKNAHVVLTARSDDRGEDALNNVRSAAGPSAKLDLMHLDLSSFKSVEAFAGELLAKDWPIHCLVNNAGVFLVKHQKTVDGFEITMQTNHFGPFLLTHLLMDKIKASAPARIVWVSSPAEAYGKIDWEDLKGEKDTSSDINIYGRTKLANFMTSFEFNRRLVGSNVESFACQPGIASTDLYNKDKIDDDKLTSKGMNVIQSVVGQSEERGALSLLYCATSEEVQGKGDSFYGPNPLNWGNTEERSPSNAAAMDAEACHRLYNQTRMILCSTLNKDIPAL